MMSIDQVAKRAYEAWMQAHGRPSGVLWEQMAQAWQAGRTHAR